MSFDMISATRDTGIFLRMVCLGNVLPEMCDSDAVCTPNKSENTTAVSLRQGLAYTQHTQKAISHEWDIVAVQND